MIKESLATALSDQVNAEYYSAYLYLSLSAWADREGFKGVANWLFVQAQEEMAHGTHIYRFILDRGASPSFADVKAPVCTCASVGDLFEQVLAHERKVSGLIDGIASLAHREGDHASYNFIMWYVNEQVEEEAGVEELVAKIKMLGDHQGLLFNLDAALAARTFTDPFAAAPAP
jgi:ferritin